MAGTSLMRSAPFQCLTWGDNGRTATRDARIAGTEPRAQEAVEKFGTDLSAVRQVPEKATARRGAAVCPVNFFSAPQASGLA